MNNIIKRVWNQNRMVNIEDLLGMAFQAESGGHTFEISGVNDAGESVPLSGTVAGVFMRPDGTDVALTGSASDGVVSVTLSDACYAVNGRFGLYIFVTSNSRKTCVYACIGTVAQTSTGTVAGDTPQDVVDLINAINAAIASIPADYTDLLDSIAPSFSDSTAYTTGEIVWYDGLLYQFTAYKATGSWDATKVRQVSVTTAQFDTANLTDGAVTMQKLGSDVIAELDNKANIDGSYESMTVGNAEQIVSSVGIEDQTPYNFRTSGGSTEIGDREELNAVVGVSVPWNQNLKEVNSTNWAATAASTSVSIADGVATVTAGSQYAGLINAAVNRPTFPNGRKMFYSVSVKLTTAVANAIRVKINNQDQKYAASSTAWQTISGFFTWDSTKAATFQILDFRASDRDAYQVKEPILIDLTQMFGSTIADYIYALEQSNAGSGVAYFRKLFPKPYYAYNSGELLSVQTSAHRMVGFNQWDEEWENGRFNITTGAASTGNGLRSKNMIRVIPNTVYHAVLGNYSQGVVVLLYYDANGGFLSYEAKYGADFNFTTPDSACYLNFNLQTSSEVTAYHNDICINLSWDGERDGEYEPYEAHEYALDDITLRGILKLDASNNLYANGDRYLPDGTVERTINQITINGSEAWYKDPAASSGLYDSYYIQHNDLKKRFDYRDCFLTSKGYDVALGYNTFVNNDHGILVVSGYHINANLGQNWIYLAIKKDAGCDTSAKFKEWLANNPFDLIYELATVTTETASPYQQTQIVDDFGTEEFVDAAVEANERDVAIPVGNETVYKPNLRAKLEMAPDSPDGDGDYIVRQTNGQNSYIPLVEVKELPDFPSNDGSYKLRCTVSNGTVTLSWVSDS